MTGSTKTIEWPRDSKQETPKNIFFNEETVLTLLGILDENAKDILKDKLCTLETINKIIQDNPNNYQNLFTIINNNKRLGIKTILLQKLCTIEMAIKILNNYQEEYHQEIFEAIKYHNIPVDDSVFGRLDHLFHNPLVFSNHKILYIKGSIINTKKTNEEIDHFIEILEENKTIQDTIKTNIYRCYANWLFSEEYLKKCIDNEIPFDFIDRYLYKKETDTPFSLEEFTFLEKLKDSNISWHSQYLCFYRHKKNNLTIEECIDLIKKYPKYSDFETYMVNDENFKQGQKN